MSGDILQYPCNFRVFLRFFLRNSVFFALVCWHPCLIHFLLLQSIYYWFKYVKYQYTDYQTHHISIFSYPGIPRKNPGIRDRGNPGKFLSQESRSGTLARILSFHYRLKMHVMFEKSCKS